jgi:hypothetical protein
VARAPVRRLAAVDLDAQALADRVIERDGHFHQQIVRMLPIVDPRTVADFAAGQQVGIAAAANRPRFDADHRDGGEGAGTEIVTRFGHQPVDAAPLPCAARAAVVEELHERIAVEHQRPASERPVRGVHRRLTRQPRGARSIGMRGSRCLGASVLMRNVCGLMTLVLLVATRWRVLREPL